MTIGHFGGPPSDIPDERLFRLLTRSPRAYLPVKIPTLQAGSCGAFRVYALTPDEELDCAEAADDVPEQSRRDVLLAELVARSLYLDGSPYFASAADMLDMYEDDFARVAGATWQALSVIAPSYSRVDSLAWDMVLCRGAKHYRNYRRSMALALCIDIVPMSKAKLPRPDRFFGVPMGEVTDGQWMAFRAAFNVHVESKDNS